MIRDGDTRMRGSTNFRLLRYQLLCSEGVGKENATLESMMNLL